MSDTPDLNLAVIGNCQIAALIDAAGSIVWACLPRLDGDPVFSALLAPEGEVGLGAFSIAMEDTAHIRQRYLRNTAVVETVHEGKDIALRVTDFCPRYRSQDRMHRPSMIIRIVEPLAGRPVVRVRLRPTGSYGAVAPHVTLSSHSIRFCTDDLTYRVTTDGSLTAIYEERTFVLTKPLTFILGDDEPISGAPAAFGRALLDQTRIYWEDWVRGLAIPVDYQEAVIRAAITLKLCTFEDTGAVLAALTTSIPEAPDTIRNWDYRYCWLRDSYFTVHAMNRLGVTQTMEEYLRFIHNMHVRTPVGELQPLYGISGEAQLTEVTVSSLRGYRGMGPVRIGNQAYEQKQYDIYGAIILAAAQLFYDERLEMRDRERLFAGMERLGEHAVKGFGTPDAGPWELRGIEASHTFTAVMSWAGCDRLAQIAVLIGKEQAATHWREQAASMHARILAEAWNPTLGAFVATFGGDSLDATALLLAELRFLPASDERFVATVDAIGKHLRCGDLLFRYRQPDDFGVPTTTFTVCAFWYVNALGAVGRIEQARELFGRLLSRRNAVGLLSEDIDPLTGELWGNFPQSYSMVGIIISALRLSRPWEDVRMSRLVAISNRVSVPRKGAAPGGLAVGVLAAMRAQGGLWIGWSGQVAEGAHGGIELIRRERLAFATFDLTKPEYDEFYLGFSNGALWPLFHHFLQAFHYSENEYASYLGVNRRFAEQTVPLLRPDDLIWVHDYHLIPLGSALRALGVAQPIGFFLHIPFPGFAAFRALPVHRELLECLLAYDLVGFQTRDDLAAFHAAVAEVWGQQAVLADGSVQVGDRHVSAQIFPIGVEVDEIQKTAAAAPSTEAYRRIVAGLLGRRLIIGVDRLDYSKGLVERFRAYEKFLATYPENHNDVTFVQIAPLSRTDVREYEDIRQQLEQASGRTNGRFADPDWTPVRYLNKNVPHGALMGYLRAAKVALVTPLRDGMNLVAKEFVAAQDPADPGVLILSTLAGAARELTTALLVNPYDVTGVAQALQSALWMPLAQRRERYEAMMSVIRGNDVHSWNRRFLAALHESVAAAHKKAVRAAPMSVSRPLETSARHTARH